MLPPYCFSAWCKIKTTYHTYTDTHTDLYLWFQSSTYIDAVIWSSNQYYKAILFSSCRWWHRSLEIWTDTSQASVVDERQNQFGTRPHFWRFFFSATQPIAGRLQRTSPNVASLLWISLSKIRLYLFWRKANKHTDRQWRHIQIYFLPTADSASFNLKI